MSVVETHTITKDFEQSSIASVSAIAKPFFRFSTLSQLRLSPAWKYRFTLMICCHPCRQVSIRKTQTKPIPHARRNRFIDQLSVK